MIQLIKSDIYRILKGKAIYISILLLIIFIIYDCFGLTPIWLGTKNNLLDTNYSSNIEKVNDPELYNAKSTTEQRAILKKYPYELDKAIMGSNANLYYIFIVVIVITLVTDFSNKTIKNTISSSISRKKYYLSKLIIGLLMCTILVLLNNCGLYIVNLLMNGNSFSSSIIEITKITIYQLPLMYGVISMLICIGVLTKKTSLFNAITIPLLLLFQTVFLGIKSLFKLNSIALYEFQIALCRLANNPSNIFIVKCISLGIIFTIIFSTIGFLYFKKAEIK